MATSWDKLTVRAADPVLEALSSLLVDWGAEGTLETANAISAFYRPESREEIEALLARYAADLREEMAWEWEVTVEEDWWESWKKHFRPAQVSPRLAVCPSWEADHWRPSDPSVRVIRMDPGRAFGTGTHETSRLCLRLIDECLAERPAASMLDVGCGSGILSIGASLLGVPFAVALDIDPVATESTKENVQANGAGQGVVVLCADLRAVRGGYDLVVANILYQVLLGLAPAIVERVAAGGRVILSGMLQAELASAASVYGRLGLSLEREESEGEWGALILRRDA